MTLVDWTEFDGSIELDVEQLLALPETEQRERLAQLEAYRDHVKRNPLWKYVPHAKQHAFHAAPAMTRAFVGGNQSGKTTAGINDTLLNTIEPELVPPWLAKYRRWHEKEIYVRVVVVDLVQALEGVMLPKIRQAVPKAALWKGSWERAWNARRRRLQFENGSWWEFLTHDMDVDQFAGGTLHRIWYDEEPPGNKGKLIAEENDMRLLHYDGDTLFTFTPLLGLSWAFHELTVRGELRTDEDVFGVHVDMDDNPYLSERAKKRALRKMSAAARLSRKSGLFVHRAGRIYPEFSREEHVVPAVELPRHRKTGESLANVYVGIDPGIDHPTGLVWVTHDEEDRFEVIRAMKLPATTQQVVGLIAATNAELRVTPRWYVIDPSARNRNPQTGRSLQMNYLDHGIVTIPGNNDRRSGFDRVKELLAPIDSRTEERLPPRLTIHAGNEALEEEFENYRWKQAPNVESVGREEPIKVNDDILDALRYVIMSRTIAGDEQDEDEKHEPENVRAFRQHLARLARRGRYHHPVGPGTFR